MTNNKPVILLPGKHSAKDVETLRKESKIWREVDLYAGQLEELLEVRYPAKDERERNKEAFLKHLGKDDGAWVYYPWSGVLLHTVGPRELFELRTNRNQNIIIKEEQLKLHSSVIGVAGMSVGAGIAIGSVYAGMAGTIKLADFDQLETANLNRIRETLPNIGQAKVELAARAILELDPFTEVMAFPEGVTAANIDNFFSDPKLSVVIDEIDDFKIKVMLRVKAKENKVPLLMFTSLGDNILVDVERYDLSPQPQLFNGTVGNVADEILASDKITPEDIKRYAVQLVGAEYVPTRALASLPEIGTSLVGRPQLYGTIAVDGGLATYIIRQILLGGKVKSGRYFIQFADLIKLESADFNDDEKRASILKMLMGLKK